MSSVFYKFRNQKDSQRVTFDGTGISVFELKREIINLSKLGDGTDFDLILRNPDTDEEYDDDTTIVPRSTSVLAIRRPAAKPRQGRAARYVSGRMPVNAKNSYRTEQSNTPAPATSRPVHSTSKAAAAMDSAETEEERIKAMFEMGGAQWEQQQAQMSTAQRVYNPNFKNKNANVPDHPPPPGYVCYRCGKKGHWIQVCPTNDNPEFENKPRIKRITGIPKAFLKQVEEPIGEQQQDGLTEDTREPASVMVDAEGNRVVAVPDFAAWQQYQEKTKAAAANKEVAAQGSKELQERGLECPIDKRLFVDPVKTPCCGKTYCSACIDNTLSDNDLICPNCSTRDVLIEEMEPDQEMNTKIKAYEEEKKTATKAAQQVKSDSPNNVEDANKKTSRSPTPNVKGGESPSGPNKRKRSVDDQGANDRRSQGPVDNDRPKSSGSDGTKAASDKPAPGPSASAMSQEEFVKQMNAMAGLPPNANGRNTNSPFNPMSMPPMMPNMNGMMNPMMMQQYAGMMPGMNGFPMNGMNMGMGMPNGNMGWQNGMNGMNGQWNGAGRGMAPTQPRQFNHRAPNQTEDPYMRKPVNPNRQQGRNRRMRQADYKELS